MNENIIVIEDNSSTTTLNSSLITTNNIIKARIKYQEKKIPLVFEFPLNEQYLKRTKGSVFEIKEINNKEIKHTLEISYPKNSNEWEEKAVRIVANYISKGNLPKEILFNYKLVDDIFRIAKDTSLCSILPLLNDFNEFEVNLFLFFIFKIITTKIDSKNGNRSNE